MRREPPMLGPLTLALALSFAPAAVGKTVAIVDLSSPKAPSVADALRRTQRQAMSTSRTNAAVSDAESLGIICSVDDVQCLEKLMVIIKADEMLAFAAAGSQMSVVRLGRGAPQRAKVKMAPSATATAVQALDALDRSGSSPAAAKDTTEVIVLEDRPKDATTTPKDATTTPKDTTTTPKDATPVKDATATKDDPKSSAPTTVTPTATTAGVSPALAVAIVGGVVGVGCGTGAVITSVDLANKLTAAKNGQRPLDQKAYDNGSTVFWLLTACTGVGIAGAGVGGAFVAIE